MSAITLPGDIGEEAIRVLKETICRDLSDAELAYFLQVCRHKRLDPFGAQICAVKRQGQLTIQVQIGGLRATADRTGQVDGQDGPYWCGHDGQWADVWLSKDPPAAAKVIVYRKGCSRPFVGVARYDEYVQMGKDRKTGKWGVNSMWRKMPSNQLAKCAEALALRKAFPEELSGLCSDDEMGQADNPRGDVAVSDAELLPTGHTQEQVDDSIAQMHRECDRADAWWKQWEGELTAIGLAAKEAHADGDADALDDAEARYREWLGRYALDYEELPDRVPRGRAGVKAMVHRRLVKIATYFDAANEVNRDIARAAAEIRVATMDAPEAEEAAQ